MNSRTLKELQKKWYQKLKDTGFEDLENFNGPDGLNGPLKAPKGGGGMKGVFSKYQVHRNIAESYYEKALYLLNTYQFESELDKNIWLRHCEGFSYRKIALDLGISYGKLERRMAKMKEVLKKYEDQN